ncbi:MAG: serine/threonine protein kinase [Deltaproteobacteria bacterium]|nr:serine/threonine protein kinase [Deltaproteobacteria bacterium]
MSFEPGTCVGPNLRLVEPLGEGAMGSVWIADHLTLKTRVAVKFISRALGIDDQEARERFIHEASTSAQIKSPHVVQVFDQGFMDDGTPYIVMELLEGEGLGERLERTRWLSLRQAGQIVTHVARALAAAHKLGIVHRDIKPDNVFLTSTDEGLFAKVFDFGIAKQTKLPTVRGLTNPGVLVGTPEFMSPEQVASTEDVDYRADLWALAVLAYCMVAGELPFKGNTLGLLCVALLKGEFRRPSLVRDGLPPEMDAWFERALAREPDKRFSSAKDMALGFVQTIPGGMSSLEAELIDSQRGAEVPPPTHSPTALGLAPERRGYVSVSEPADDEDSIPLRRTPRLAIAALVALAVGAAALVVVLGREEHARPTGRAPAAAASSARVPASAKAAAAGVGTEPGASAPAAVSAAASARVPAADGGAVAAKASPGWSLGPSAGAETGPGSPSNLSLPPEALADLPSVVVDRRGTPPEAGPAPSGATAASSRPVPPPSASAPHAPPAPASTEDLGF